MRFMIIRKADPNTEAGVMPSQELLAAMGAYMEELEKAGVLLGGEGLQPSSRGARVRFKGGKPTVTDGPFTETKELVAGYMLVQARSREEAVEWARRWPAVGLESEVELEIRQVFEADDFGAEFTPELREAEEKMRERLAGKK
jgi:hypothetical protein